MAILAIVAGVVVSGRAPRAPGTGLIVGTVVDGDSGAVISAAVVTLGVGGANSGPPPGFASAAGSQQTDAQPRVMTADDGRFVFRDLPMGSFTLAVTKPGYVPGAYGRRSVSSTGSQVIDLADGQRMTDARIPIWKFASITGTVVDESGEPLVGVVVRACPRAVLSGWVRIFQPNEDLSFGNVSDDRGIFRAARLVPGDYIVVATSATTTVPVSTQDALAHAVAANTQADLRREFSASNAPWPAAPGIRFDDHVLAERNDDGPGLLPNDNPGRLRVYPTTYYGGSMSAARAAVVTLKSGESRAAVDIQIQPVTAATVSGTVMGPRGPEGNLGLRLVPSSSDEFTAELLRMNAITVTDRLGRFTFLGVPTGSYVLRSERVPPRGPGAAADAPIPDDPTLWAAVPLTVGDEGVRDLALTLNHGARFKGRLEWDGTARQPTPARITQIRVAVEPATGWLGGAVSALGTGHQTLAARVDTSGQITSYEVIPGRYLVTVGNLPAGWTLKSATIDGIDASVHPFDLASTVDNLVVTLTDHPSELTGTVRTAQGASDPTADVVIFPADTKTWLETGTGTRILRQARVSRDGTYRVIGLPPGDYYLAAIPDELSTNWSEAKSLENLARLASRFQMTDGGKLSHDLQTIKVQ